MTRSFFFILFFPPALMNLLLVQSKPADLTHYLLAGYVIAAFPAAVLALTDEVLEGMRDVVRATWCSVIGMVLSPAAMAVFFGADVQRLALAAASGAIAAFLCSVGFARLDCPKRNTSSATEVANLTSDAAASTPRDLSPQPAT
jgi:Na+-driven multidrug efflux pump